MNRARGAVMFRVLGELSIETDDGRLPLPSGHQLVVLAVLLINANKRVSTVDLLRAAWANTEVDPTQLHKSVSALRRTLAPLGPRTELVTHQGYGYELRVAEEDLDKLVFERLIRDANRAAAEAREQDELDLLWQALRLWTGPHPLAGIPGEAFRREAAGLEQRRKRAAVRMFDLELARGRGARILDELSTMVEYHPTDRRLCEQLMLTLYRSGHGIDAIDVYNGHVAALQQEPGTDPEPGLRDLMYAIASADDRIIERYETTVAEPVLVPRQLPADTADPVGRDEAIAEATWLLGREKRTTTPVVVVTGPGGIGKTVLAVHIAHLVRAGYPDGQLYLELSDAAAQHLAAEELLAQILRGFGVTTMPETRAERVALYRTLVGQRRVLLVLDDARDEAQIRDLIPGNPGCGVLITARRRLPNLDGALHLPTLAPLEPRQAMAMFHRAIRRCGVDPDTEPDATQRVVELCAGLPLALAIVAALRGRDPGRTTEDIAERLAHQRLDGFVSGDRSVARSIAVGFDRLDPDARALFLGLGLLPLPDFGLWTAAAILSGTTADPAEVLLRLAGCHMIQPTGPGMRYRFHDLTRRYARHRAELCHPEPDCRDAVVRRVYGALLTLARRAHRGIYAADFDLVSSGVPDWPAPEAVFAGVDRDPLAWYEAERANIRAAVRHAADIGLDDLCWDLAVSAHEFYTLRGYFDDWYATHQLALDACRAAGNLRGEAATVVMLGQPALVAGRRASVPTVDELARAVSLFGQLDDPHGQAIALRTLASALRRRGHLDRALAAFSQAQHLYEASGDLVGRWQSVRCIGQIHLELGDPDEALKILETAREEAMEADRPRLLAQTAYWIGQAHLARGDLTEAETDFQLVLDLIGEADATGRAYAVHGLGDVALRAGDRDEAAARLDTAAALATATPARDAVLEGRIQRSLADLHLARGDHADQADALRQAATCFDRGNAAYHRAQTLVALGDALAAAGEPEPARQAWTEALARYAALDLLDTDSIHDRLNALPT